MPASWRGWARRYLGDPNAKPTPANQEIVAAAKLRALHAGLGTWRRTAYWWLTGSSRTTGWSSHATRYVLRVMGYFDSTTDADVAAIEEADPCTQGSRLRPPRRRPRRPRSRPRHRTEPIPTATLQAYSEKSPQIAYTGTWKSAGHPGYAGDAAAYATAAGATATFTFTGTRVTWYGPVGPTRGKATVSIDGKYRHDRRPLRDAGSAPHKALFSSAGRRQGAHTLVITVVGTAGHPYVAIDGFVVAK